MQGQRAEGPHPVYVDPRARASLFALLDDAFPRMPERIATAAADGFVWEDVTEPFVRFEGSLAGWCMVRGDWPLGHEVPFAVGRLAEH